MKKFIIFIILAFFLSLQAAHAANESQRRCLLLPVQDEVGGAIGFGVFEQLERYLKESEWCYYKSNSEILNILANYKKNLKNHLNTPDVLRVLATKTKSGSLIKVEIQNEVKGASVSLSILGANGEDVYFKEKSIVENSEIEVIAQRVKNWLDQYNKQIPFDGVVTGILGDQFTVDMGDASGVKANNEIVIVRPLRKKRHPLLKEVVEYDTEKIADAKIFHVTRIQSQGEIQTYKTRKRIQLGDWVLVNKNAKSLVQERATVTRKNDFNFGRLGTVSILMGLGSGTDTISESSSSTELGGVNFGVLLQSELWATRNYWGGINLGKKFSSLSLSTGSASGTPESMTLNNLELIGAYRYLPLGFFYGPRVDLFLGYGSYDFEMDAGGGFTESTFSGLMMGVKGSIPLDKKIRLSLQLDFLISPGYEEQILVNGEADAATSYHIAVGGQYAYTPRMSIDGYFDIRSNKAKFKDPTKSVTFKDMSINVGSTFTF